LQADKTRGMISNPSMKRRQRDGKGPKPAPAASSKVEPVPAAFKPGSQKNSIADKVKQEVSSTPSKETPPSTAGAKKATSTASLKRAGSGGIGQMFAKAAANPKLVRKDSATTSATGDKVDLKALSDDGEDDSEALPPPKAADEGESTRKSRKDREAELRRMMEESDEEDEEEDDEPAKADSPAKDEPMEDAPVEEEEPVKEEPAEVVSSAGDGRKRGKRRVTKKKQVMDDDGYLGMRVPSVVFAFR
jgi:DNA polymerase delta subunit 3